MKRGALQRTKLLTLASIIFSTFLSTLPMQSAYAANCNQNVNNSTGVVAYESGIYCYVAFKDTTITYTWTKPSGLTKIDLLVVGGGGGGGARHAGGGGAGGIITLSDTTINSTSLTINVGGGGAGGAAKSSGDAGSEGSNGTFSRVTGGGLSDQTALGGGGGAWGTTSGSGASSGGGGCCGQGLGSATSPQGKSGGSGYYQNGVMWAGGGGGGYGNAGDAASGSGAGSGGSGGYVSWITQSVQSNLVVGHYTNSNTYFAGGGGGSTTSGNAGSGGIGGGGAGVNNTSAGTAGTANTGGGGGGGGMNGAGASKGGDGGSGVVVIRYIWDVTAPVITGPGSATGATSTKSISEGATAVHSFTASETVTWSISGTDSSFFSITVGGVLTISARDFESPADSDRNNSYIVEINATDTVNLSSKQTLTVSITNVNEAPTITINGSATTHAISQSENQSSVVTYTGTDVDSGTTLSWSISGTDAADFSIVSSTGALSFAANPDFEAAADSDGNNVYIVVVTLSDGALTDTQTLTVTITDANEISVLGAPSVSGDVYKGITTTISITSNAAGKVRFFVSGKRIANCLAVSTSGSGSSYTASCLWKPAVQGKQNLTASFTPNLNTFTSSASPKTDVFILRRTGKR
jgi:hypothetical protein